MSDNIVIQKGKRCPKCSEVKPVEEFSKNKANRDGLQSQCKPCHRKSTDKWAAKSKVAPISKKCRICEMVLPVDNFYPEKRSVDGYKSMCKTCDKAKSIKWASINRIKDRARKLKWRWDNIEKARTSARLSNKLRYKNGFRKYYQRRLRILNKEQYQKTSKAHYAVQKAIRAGQLVRPELCTICNKPGSRIEAHHPDHEKVLEVIFCCPPCHWQLENLPDKGACFLNA